MAVFKSADASSIEAAGVRHNVWRLSWHVYGWLKLQKAQVHLPVAFIDVVAQ